MVGKQEAAAGHVVATIKKPKESTAATLQSVSSFSFSLGAQPVVLQIQGVFFPSQFSYSKNISQGHTKRSVFMMILKPVTLTPEG